MKPPFGSGKTNPIQTQFQTGQGCGDVEAKTEIQYLDHISHRRERSPLLRGQVRSQSFYGAPYFILCGTSRPCSVISFESDIIFLASPSAIMRPLSSRTALSASAAAKFISQVAIIKV